MSLPENKLEFFPPKFENNISGLGFISGYN